MNYLTAIKLLAPYHAAQLIWVVPTDPTATSPGPTGQLTTGLDSAPLLAVNAGQVIADDLYDVLDDYASHSSAISYSSSAYNSVPNSAYNNQLPCGLFELAY